MALKSHLKNSCRWFSIIAVLAVCLSEQTFLFETRKLGQRKTSLYLGFGAVREFR